MDDITALRPHPLDAKSTASIRALCRRFGLARLVLFGSATTDRFEPARSDLDFLYSFEDRERADYADAFFGLKDAVQDLFRRPVDLIAEYAVENPYFRAEADRTAHRIFPAE